MLKMSFQRPPESHLASWTPKYSKWASRNVLRTIWRAEPRNVQNELPEASWEPFGELNQEMLKMSFQRPPGSHLASWNQKSSKWASRSLLRIRIKDNYNSTLKATWFSQNHHVAIHSGTSEQKTSGLGVILYCSTCSAQSLPASRVPNPSGVVPSTLQSMPAYGPQRAAPCKFRV